MVDVNPVPVQADDPEPEVRVFLDAVVQSGLVWALEDAAGWALSESAVQAGQAVFPLWSSEALAAQAASGEWAGYAVSALDLEELMANWLPGLDADGHAVGIDWDADLEGVEMPPLALQADLEARLGIDDADDDAD